MRSKLILGTAGLGGIPYGGKSVNVDDAYKIISRAWDMGITSFDTAPAYGQAESILSRTLKHSPATIYTKTTGDVKQALRSQALLRCPHFLWHNWQHKWWKFGREKLPEWIDGVSIYSEELPYVPSNAEYCQVDWSIFRQTKYPPKGTILRSVFMRGKAPFLEEAGVKDLCLGAALSQPGIHGVVVGCMSIDEVDVCVKIADRGPIDADLMERALLCDMGANNPETDMRRIK